MRATGYFVVSEMELMIGKSLLPDASCVCVVRALCVVRYVSLVPGVMRLDCFYASGLAGCAYLIVQR